MKKWLLVLLTLALLLPATLFASCKKKKPVVDPDNSSEQKDEVAEILGFPKQDYGKREFKILLNNSSGFQRDFYAEEGDNDTVNREVYNRNLACQDYLKIALTYDQQPGNWNSGLATKLRDLVSTNSCSYDMVAMGLNTAMIGGEIDAYTNVLDMLGKDQINLAHSWWIQDIIEQNSINEQLYFLCGDACRTAYTSIGTVFANLSVAEKFKIYEDSNEIYQTVKDGDWTMSEFFRLFKLVGENVDDDDQVLDPTKGDTVGWIIGDSGVPVRLMWSSCGFNMIERQDNGTFALRESLTDTMLTFIGDLKTAYDDIHSIYIAGTDAATGKSATESTLDAFVGNRVFLLSNMLNSAEGLRTREITSKFAILPLPKYNAQQEDYISTAMGNYNALFFPATVSNEKLSAQVAEFMGYYGQKNIIPAYYDKALKYQQNDEEANVEMLDLIRDKLRVTPNESYGTIGINGAGAMSMTQLTKANVEGTSSNPQSFYANPVSTWTSKRGDIAALIESYVLKYYE